MDLKTRATNMLTTPSQEWRVIATEATTPSELMTSYAAPLSAIPAVCSFIGMTVVGMSAPLVGTVRVGAARSLSNAIVSWVLGLAGIYLAAIVIEKLAPTFQSRGGTVQALKLVVYASTPVWVAGVLNLVPGALAALVLLAALYAIYVFDLGLPILMHTPSDKVIPYMLIAAIVMVVVFVVVGAITGALTGVSIPGVRGIAMNAPADELWYLGLP